MCAVRQVSARVILSVVIRVLLTECRKVETYRQSWAVPRYKSIAVLLRGTFLVPLSVPSIIFLKCTVFGAVVTF